MDIKELKKLALGLISAKDRKSELEAGMSLFEAILTIKDDPRIDFNSNQTPLEMADLVCSHYPQNSAAYQVAAKYIDKYYENPNHEDLVDMACSVINNRGFYSGVVIPLSEKIIERFGKRTPQNSVRYEINAEDGFITSFTSKENALEYIQSTAVPCRLFKIVVTEEI